MKTQYHERTLVILKPDSIQRGLIGEIISRFEKRGLKIVAAKFVLPTREQAKEHYSMPESDKIKLGTRTIDSYKEKGIVLEKTPIQIADDVIRRLVEYLTTGPVLALVIEAAHAVEVVRKIRGATNPLAADLGSITADLTIDSYFISDHDDRAIRNLVHASGSKEEAEREIALWFDESEIIDYDLAIEKILYSKDWEETREKITKAH